MSIDPNGPADTNMMRIVHNALRRDLHRARSALTRDPLPDVRQLDNIARHLVWMMRFLEAHHESEDSVFYPIVREREPAAAPLFDDMAADHRSIARCIVAVEAAADAGDGGDDRRVRLLAAIDDMLDVLLPHLRREEDEAMTVLSRVMTAGEWSTLEQEHNIRGKSKAQLGREGHWLIDDATPEDRDRVLGLVPAVPRLIVRHLFGPGYRRRKRACWTPRRVVQHDSAVSVTVDAGIDAVWDVVKDPTRVGEWSHECVAAAWVGEVHQAEPGARFRGRNRQGLARWGRLCEVTQIEQYQLVWRTIPTTFVPDSTEWTLRLVAVEGGTRIEQTYALLKGTWLEPFYATLLPAHRDRAAALSRDLERIGEVAKASEAPACESSTIHDAVLAPRAS